MSKRPDRFVVGYQDGCDLIHGTDYCGGATSMHSLTDTEAVARKARYGGRITIFKLVPVPRRKRAKKGKEK